MRAIARSMAKCKRARVIRCKVSCEFCECQTTAMAIIERNHRPLSELNHPLPWIRRGMLAVCEGRTWGARNRSQKGTSALTKRNFGLQLPFESQSRAPDNCHAGAPARGHFHYDADASWTLLVVVTQRVISRIFPLGDSVACRILWSPSARARLHPRMEFL